MRKLFIFLALIGVILFGVGTFSNNDASGLISPTPEPRESIQIPQEKNASVPVTLSIPKLEIETKVEHVGLDKDNAMDIPKVDMNAAWYQLGAKPGELGNSVMAGHFDKKDGTPAVFAKLGELEKGDEIIVTDENGKTLKFNVTETASYKLDEFPLKAVFGSHTKARLNLITCEGIFDKSSKLYSHRLVVFSELVD